MVLLINPCIVILQGTGSQVTLGFPHSQIRLRVASLKVREHGRVTPVAYELASDTYHGLGVMTLPLRNQHRPTPLHLPTRLTRRYHCSSCIAYSQIPRSYPIDLALSKKDSDKFSFTYFCSISSRIENSCAAVLLKVPPFMPSNALFASHRTTCGPPTTLPLTCLILPHCQSCHSCQFPAAPAPMSQL